MSPYLGQCVLMELVGYINWTPLSTLVFRNSNFYCRCYLLFSSLFLRLAFLALRNEARHSLLLINNLKPSFLLVSRIPAIELHMEGPKEGLTPACLPVPSNRRFESDPTVHTLYVPMYLVQT